MESFVYTLHNTLAALSLQQGQQGRRNHFQKNDDQDEGKVNYNEDIMSHKDIMSNNVNVARQKRFSAFFIHFLTPINCDCFHTNMNLVVHLQNITLNIIASIHADHLREKIDCGLSFMKMTCFCLDVYNLKL